MAGGEATLQRGVEHQTTLTDIGDLFGFWCTCGRSVIGWRLRWEAEEAAEAHKAGNKAFGTCVYCCYKRELTRHGWCVKCHPRMARSHTSCKGCGFFVRRDELSRDGKCSDCLLDESRWRDLAGAR